MSTKAAPSLQTPRWRIYLSHAGEDKETIARPLYKRLQEHGLSVFLDVEYLRLGDGCPEPILEALETAPVGVFIMSPEFVAKEWPMRELLTFVRRYDHAVEHNKTPPLLIPVFYRFASLECRDPAMFDTYSDLFERHGLFRRAIDDGGISLTDAMHALDTAAKVWSIRNDVGATNSYGPSMAQTRETFIRNTQNSILKKLGIESSLEPAADCYIARNLVPLNPPRLSLNYDTLTTCEGMLKDAVLRRSESRVVAAISVGMRGIGKTCALRGLAEDLEIRREFSDGILHMQLGIEATIRNVIEGIANIVRCTGGAKVAKSIATVKTVAEASQEASEWFGERRCLFLVDDIWHVNGVDVDVLDDMARMVGTKSRMVYTTRDRYFVHDATEYITLYLKKPHGELSRQMLMTHAGFDADLMLEDKNEEAVRYFLSLCQGLPLGLGIIGRIVRQYSLDCRPREDGWSEFHRVVMWHEEGLMATKSRFFSPISKILELSLMVLEKRNGHDEYGYWFRGLSVVQKKQSVPAEMLQKLWNLGSLEETKAVVESFAEVSVVERRRTPGSMYVRLHDLILDVAVLQAAEKSETKSFFKTLVHNYMACGEGKRKDDSSRGVMSDADWELCYGWWKLQDDGYIRNNVCRLLRNAGYVVQLLWLLSQPQWIVSRLVEFGIPSLEEDLYHGREVCHATAWAQADRVENLQMIGRAGRMSALFVNKNPRAEEGWFQMHGRLQWHAMRNELTREFVERMEKCAPRPWLKASAGLLRQAGSAWGPFAAVSVSGQVLGTHEERDAIWILSSADGEEENGLYVGKYDRENERYREVSLQIDKWSNVECTSFLRDNRAMTAHEDGRIRVWDRKTGACQKIVKHNCATHICFIDFSEHGIVVVSQTSGFSVELRKAMSGEPVGQPLRGHTDEVTSVAVSADGTRIVSGSFDSTVRMWDAFTGSAIGEPLQGHTDWVGCVAVSADGLRIVSGSLDKTVRVWDAHTGFAVGQPLEGHKESVSCVAVSADGTRIVSCSLDGSVRVWNAHTGHALGYPLQGHTDAVRCVAVSADGTRIVSGSDDRTVRVWNVPSDDGSAWPPPQSQAGKLECVEVSADGTRIVTGSDDGTVRVWDAHTGSAVGQPLRGHTGRVRCVAVGADGTRIVSGSDDGTVRVWDLHAGSGLRSPLQGHTDDVTCVALSKDGSLVVSGADDKTLRVWDANTGRPMGLPLKGHTDWLCCVVVSADGTRIVSGSLDQTVRVWVAQSGSVVGQPLRGHTDLVRAVAVNADGTRIVSQDEEMGRLWSMEAGGGECVLTSHDAAWQRTLNELELTWSESKWVSQREVSDFGEHGSKIVLGTAEEELLNVSGSDMYFTKDMMRTCRVLR